MALTPPAVRPSRLVDFLLRQHMAPVEPRLPHITREMLRPKPKHPLTHKDSWIQRAHQK